MSSGSIAVETGETGTRSSTLEGVIRIAVTAAQLLLIALVIREFELESRGLYTTLLFAAAGFVLQASLPRRWRMACFTALSVAAIFLLFGVEALWVVAVGAALLGLSLLPVRFGVRLALVLGAVVALGVARQGRLPLDLPAYIWPVVAGMFMFRLVLYMQAVRHEGPPRDLWGTLAYLFMLPNAAFPFFPIVDYKTFLRQHYDAPESALYQRGLSWMARGVVHLLLYRAIYHFVVLDPAQLRTLSDVVQYCLQTYLLYLRVSGQFHIIIGLLHLFGFRLPESHHLYYLADSFTEVWRRVNIYWKDFMMKAVYHPAFFRFRQWRGFSADRAVILATAVVMLLTWLLHGYQKFWIVGGNPFTAADTLFWFVLSVLVLLSAIRDLARAKHREAAQKGWRLGRGVRTFLVFSTIALLFTLWTSETPGAFLSVLVVARHVDLQGILMILGLAALLIAIGGWNLGVTDIRDLKLRPLSLGSTLRHGALHGGGLICLALLAQPTVRDSLGPTLSGIVAHLGSSRLNARDEDQLTRGYYESLSSPNRLAGQLWDVRQQRPDDWLNLEDTEGFRVRTDFQAWDLTPGVHFTFKRQEFRVNSHGMHDQEYPLEKPAGTFRIALLGASPVMSPGVPDGTSFDARVERRLNALAEPLGMKVEILNFGVAAYSALQQVERLEHDAMAFQPDLVILTSTPPDRPPVGHHLGYVLRDHLPVPSEGLRRAIAPLSASAKPDAIMRAVAPIMDSLLESVVRRTDSVARAGGARAAVMLLRLPGYANSDDRVLAGTATRLGLPVLDLSEPYGTQPEELFAIADYDRHWNAAGHDLMTREFERALRQHAAELGLPPLWKRRE